MKFDFNSDAEGNRKEGFDCATERGVHVYAVFNSVTRMWQMALNDSLTPMDLQEIGQLFAMFAGMSETINQGRI